MEISVAKIRCKMLLQARSGNEMEGEVKNDDNGKQNCEQVT